MGQCVQRENTASNSFTEVSTIQYNSKLIEYLYGEGQVPQKQIIKLLSQCRKEQVSNTGYFRKDPKDDQCFYRTIFILELVKDSLDYIKDYYIDEQLKVIYLPKLIYTNDAQKLTSRDQVLDVLSIVKVLHQKGIVHGDIHPKNLAMWKNRTVLTDFDAASPVGTLWTYSHGTFGFSFKCKGMSSFQDDLIAVKQTLLGAWIPTADFTIELQVVIDQLSVGTLKDYDLLEKALSVYTNYCDDDAVILAQNERNIRELINIYVQESDSMCEEANI